MGRPDQPYDGKRRPWTERGEAGRGRSSEEVNVKWRGKHLRLVDRVPWTDSGSALHPLWVGSSRAAGGPGE